MADKNKSTARDDALRSFAKMSSPVVLQQNLIVAGLYLVGYELLKGTVIDRLRGFYSGAGIDGAPDERHAEKVVALCPKDLFRASCLWFLEQGAINDADVAEIEAIRDHRNALAHELPSFIADADRQLEASRLERIRSLVAKIDLWWVREIEIPLNPDFDGRDIPDDEIGLPLVAFFDMVLTTALQAGQGRLH
jgi:hypothetical protein